MTTFPVKGPATGDSGKGSGDLPLRAILFDFDYTLADSSAAAIECIRYALHALGLPEPDCETCAKTIGLSLEMTLVALAGEEYADRAPDFRRFFVERADAIMVARTYIYPQTPTTLAALGKRGYRRAIISNKYRYRIAETLARHGLEGLVETIVGAEDVSQQKPAPNALHLAIARLGVSQDQTLYVGDSLVDAEAAWAAGIPFVAVTTGHTPPGAFVPWHPVAILDSVGDLVPWLNLGSEDLFETEAKPS